MHSRNCLRITLVDCGGLDPTFDGNKDGIPDAAQKITRSVGLAGGGVLNVAATSAKKKARKSLWVKQVNAVDVPQMYVDGFIYGFPLGGVAFSSLVAPGSKVM